MLLGTVSPIAVRLKAHSLDNLGRTAGRLFALSTAGSIAGTFATAFWLIPELGTDQVLAAAAVALMLAAAGVALAERLAVAGAVALALAGASIGAVASLAPESGATVSASQLRNWSPVYRQQASRTTRRLDRGVAVRLRDPAHLRLAVPPDRRRRGRDEPLPPLRQLVPERHVPSTTRSGRASATRTTCSCRSSTGSGREKVLYIGLGGGSAPKRTWRDFPGVRIDAVELDPEVVDVAYEYFELPRDPRMRVTVEDGRRYVSQNDGPWDVIASTRSTPTRSPSTSRRGSSSSWRSRGSRRAVSS